ncbi:zinc finger protein Elbow isoform X2 [Toxorhynchites rutilus septentrionalis]|uniref:zinc finger protein Elbow isoform X2 n=1 Tax=Toxorhynchites rutilus septentrionalis TaxID=329112 RepID=UPI002478B3C1|nr:zinc finger protein Elbow isoform X2 [Toxorhynchites rutilus septentrionalis]
MRFDSKTSPLALLAQTCSAIGSDSPNPKLLANIENSTKNSRDKLSPGTLSTGSSSDTPKSSFKPYESSTVTQSTTRSPDDGRLAGSRNKSPQESNASSQQQWQHNRCESNQSSASSRVSPSSHSREHPENTQPQQNRDSSPCHDLSKKPSAFSNDTAESTTIQKSTTAMVAKDLSSFSRAVTSSTSSSSAIGPPYYTAYGSYPLDVMSSGSLMNPHHQLLKNAALNPYFNYSKMKPPGTPDSMMPVCRDPYCTGCALSSHMLGKLGSSSCPAGCTQCDHPGSKNFQSNPLAVSQSSATIYAHAQLAAMAAASQLPYVCNWIGSDTSYCGKRFAASEDLFQHLRTQHAAAASISEALLNPATAAAAAAGLPPTHPLFQRSYPTPPLSPARYHPYGKPSLLSPAMAGSPMASLSLQPHPSLAQYFPPYSFYGARLNGLNNVHP